MSRTRRTTAAALAACVLLAACTGEEGPVVETAAATQGEVVQTVAAAARLAPAASVTVAAPLGGEVAELLVADGDEVAAGDPLVRLTSDGLDQQLAQAEAALAAADAFGGLGGLGGADLSALGGLAGGLGGVDLSPVFGALAGQLDATLAPLLGLLADQAAALEDDDARRATQERLADAQDALDEAVADLRRAERDAATQAANAEAAQRRAARQAEQAQAEAAAAQREAAAAQRRQAELALEAVRSREDDLLVVAPAAGTVELARGGGGAGGLGDLGSLGGVDLGALGGLAGLGDLGGLGGPPEAGGGSDGGALAEGVAVAPGQTLLTLYDVSSFTVEVDVDEIDVVDVEVGQDVTVLLDAFPDAELDGRVERVAIAPRVGPTGGALFPVSIALLGVPRDLRLRVGFTASVEIVTRRVDDETVVPTSALLRRGGQEVVFVVDGDRLREVPVEVAAIGDDTAAVTGDVTPDDVVVTTGVETVSDGDPV